MRRQKKMAKEKYPAVKAEHGLSAIDRRKKSHPKRMAFLQRLDQPILNASDSDLEFKATLIGC